MKYFTFLPFISHHSFDRKKLIPILQKLWVDASMDMDNWHKVDYDDTWIIGLKRWGGTVESFIFLSNKTRKPTTNELVEVILALPNKYKYDKSAFETIELYGFTLSGILSSDI